MIVIDMDNILVKENCVVFYGCCWLGQILYNVYFEKKYGLVFLFNLFVIFMYLKCQFNM